MAHAISLKFSKEIEVLHSDIVIVVRKDGEKLGSVTLSKGTIRLASEECPSGIEKRDAIILDPVRRADGACQ